jgi:hypothetical protein
LCT